MNKQHESTTDYKLIELAVGKEYPFPLDYEDGAVSDFLRPVPNRLMILLSNISKNEKRILEQGNLECGLLEHDGSIVFIWRFSNKGKRLIFETPFNAKRVDDMSAETQSSLRESKQELSFQIQIIDNATKKVVSLLSTQLTEGLTSKFYTAVQKQLSPNSNKEAVYNPWERIDLDVLATTTNMYQLAKPKKIYIPRVHIITPL